MLINGLLPRLTDQIQNIEHIPNQTDKRQYFNLHALSIK